MLFQDTLDVGHQNSSHLHVVPMDKERGSYTVVPAQVAPAGGERPALSPDREELIRMRVAAGRMAFAMGFPGAIPGHPTEDYESLRAAAETHEEGWHALLGSLVVVAIRTNR